MWEQLAAAIRMMGKIPRIAVASRFSKTIKIKMKFPAASHGVSMKNKFNLNAASCGELNPADFAISTPHSL
jgi:hypothetical protein